MNVFELIEIILTLKNPPSKMRKDFSKISHEREHRLQKSNDLRKTENDFKAMP